MIYPLEGKSEFSKIEIPFLLVAIIAKYRLIGYVAMQLYFGLGDLIRRWIDRKVHGGCQTTVVRVTKEPGAKARQIAGE